MTNFTESEHPRASTGAFAEKPQSAPTVTLPEPLSGPHLDLLTTACDHFGADEFVEAVRGPYAGSIVVTAWSNYKYLVMDRDAATDGIVDDIVDAGKAGKVDSFELSGATGINDNVFDAMKELGEPRASEHILSALEGAGAVDRLAEHIAAYDSKLGEWFSDYDGSVILLDDNTFAFRRA
jgi:hypothetical protein